MPEYIDRQKLKERLEDFSKWCRDGRKQGVDFVLDCPLPDIPTEDVQKIRHGKWIDKWNGKYANPTYICSICKESATLENYIDELFTTHQRQKLSSYCPSCGAKMDGV